jgi:hypothetical protein
MKSLRSVVALLSTLMVFSLALADRVEAQPPFVRTVLVNPVPGNPVASGAQLITRYSSITSPSVTNSYLLKIEPGVYYIGAFTLPMRPYVDIEGSGEGVTIVYSTADATGTIAGAELCELRDLTVMNRGPNSAIAVKNVANTFSMRNVTAMADGGSLGSTGVSDFGLSTRMTSVTVKATGSSSSTGIGSHGGFLKDINATAIATNFAYAVFNAASQGELVDIVAHAESGGFAGAIRNESGGPILRNVHATSKGDIADGIVNGAGSSAQIFDAVIHASGGASFANGIRNEFSSAVINGADITVEAATSAFGISNFFSGTPSLTNVRVSVKAGGGGTGVLADGTVTVNLDRSSVSADHTSVETRDATTSVYVGTSRLGGPVSAISGLIRCIVSYDDTYHELDTKCNPIP